jgi:hypothetical protein
MKNYKNKLSEYKYNIHSQHGEDGVVEELLKRLSIENPAMCVDFGAWDGIYFSNTYRLVNEKDWDAVYIEGDKEKYKDLENTCQKNSKIIPVNKYVSHLDDENNLESILNVHLNNHDYEILCIDIDSYDLAVWESYHQKPKIVIIEINSGILPGIEQKHGNEFQGNSFTSTVNIAIKKGYNLVCHTGNLFFVRSDLINYVGLKKKFIRNPELLFDFNWIKVKPRKKRLLQIRYEILNFLGFKLNKILSK